MKVNLNEDFAFYEQLKHFYARNQRKIRSHYNDLTRNFLAYNDASENPDAFLRGPQFEALEIYVFIKEFMNNAQVADMFDAWRNREGEFSEASYYSVNDQATLFDDPTELRTDKLFKDMETYREPYPNYIYALTMGLGKTILMATCIFYEFLLARKYPKDSRFCHNALVFAPDKTVLESLREIVTFDKTKVVPPEYAAVLDQNIKIHFLDDSGTTLHVLDDSDFNIVISNTQKIVVKKKRKEDTPGEKLFNGSSILTDIYGDMDDDVADEASLIENQRFQKLCRLSQLGIYVDEAHHLFGADLQKQLRSKSAAKTSLRDTINLLSENTSIVACYNYTGTPYVNRQPLPEVVYAYGLSESIQKGYLKEATLWGTDNIKSEEFLRAAIKDFWNKYGGETYEGLTPKLAIFASTIAEAQDEVRPAVEHILSKLGVDASRVLVNVGDQKLTKDEDIHNFNNLDVAGSIGNEKQFLILVGKGREGWNCRSLFGVAMYRSPKSKIFVLQATMRCLRQITDDQQTASVYLSLENYKILDDELKKNFNMDVDGLTNDKKSQTVSREVRVLPPPRTIKLKKISRPYELIENGYQVPINFGLGNLDMDKYAAVLYEKSRLTSNTAVKTRNADEYREQVTYSLFSLCGEVARYLNISPVLIERILRESVDGPEAVMEHVNRYNEILDDVIVPCIFHELYEVKSELRTEDITMTLLREPRDRGYYIFRAKPDLILDNKDKGLKPDQVAKSFHADTYCFDSKPERELFIQYIEDSKVQKIYFTGMFTSNQGDLSIQYYDADSQRIRHYYPDFVARMSDGVLRLIEVKGDNKIDDALVKAKAAAAEELASVSGVEYVMYPSSRIMNSNVLSDSSSHQLQLEAEK